MKKILLILSFIAYIATCRAELYGNEWIDITKTHYKIKVPVDGIYRIPASVLGGAIQGLSSINTSQFIMFHNGQPVHIYVSSNSTLGPNDYIEFYGERNRGYIDSLLYRSPEDQINPDYSLFTNESVYFLTTNSNPNNPRLEDEPYNLNNHPPKEEFLMDKSPAPFTLGYYEGEYYQSSGDELYRSTYDAGEGYADTRFFGTNSQSYLLEASRLYPQGGNATIKTYFANNSEVNFQSHKAQILLNGNLLFTQAVTQDGFHLNRETIIIPASQLLTGLNTLTFSDINNPGSLRANVVGFVELEYPREYNFNGAKTFPFKIKASANTNDKTYLEINNFNFEETQPILYDLTAGKIYRHFGDTVTLKFQILPWNTERQMYLRSATRFTTVTQITPVNFINYIPSEYYIISHNNLRDDGAGNDPVEEYRAYRNGQIADIELLYDQFGYGIRKSPLAIRNFIHYAENAFGLKYVFLIGKGRENFKIRDGGAPFEQCLVPTFGYPGSDNLLSASQASDTAQIAIGRLAAENRTQVKDYLEKMKLYEHQHDIALYRDDQAIMLKDWQKKILHFSGGTSSFEQGAFRSYVAYYKQIAEDKLWGTDVSSFSKKSTEPIDGSLADVIKAKINSGVSWITFFGHSATNAFDFSIDEPQNYTNSPKFPIILSNGCFSGFIHDVGQGFSERFVFQPNAAAIAFMATSSLSLPGGLHNFSTALYKNVCVKNYFLPLGKSFKQAYNDIILNNTDASSLGVAYEMTLHGDPALMVNQYPKPDYAIENSADVTSIYFTPATVTPGTDSFEVNVIIENLGKAIDTTISVSLKRVIFDPQDLTTAINYNYSKNIKAPYYKDTMSFKLPVNISTLGYGQNDFYILVDADKKIDEMAECNNGADAAGCMSANVPTASTFILNDDIIPIYPYEFAIVPNKGVTLKASTVNPFAPERAYRFQIDTSELFATPIFDTLITQIGGVVHCPTHSNFYNSALDNAAPHKLKDSTVYYWRVKRNDAADSVYRYSSFVYLAGEYPGWNQSHYFQWKKDNYQNINLDNDRVFKFPPTTNEIKVKTGYPDAIGGNLNWTTLGWDYNNSNMHRFRTGSCGFGTGGITFAVINNVTGLPWVSHNNDNDNFGDEFGQVHCGGSGDQYGFDFRTIGTGWAGAIRNFIAAVPDGFYILLYSVYHPNDPYTNWEAELATTLRDSLGFTQAVDFNQGTMTGPFVYFTQKGDTTGSFFGNVPGSGSQIDVSFTFQGDWYQGQFTSPKIGPAKEWGSVHWRHQALETPSTDDDVLDIFGIREDGTDSLLLNTISPDNLFNNTVDAKTFPYLQLRLRTSDEPSRTPTQLEYWRVLYKKAPEAAINPAAWFQFTDTVITVGRKLHLEIGLENVTDNDMDSMLTKYTVRDAAATNRNYYVRYDTLGGLDTMHLIWDLPIDGGNYVGLNKIVIEANPDDDQLEQFHFNNFAEITFTATGDKINPLLDVTFDNQHIMNCDIVSAKPNILITLKDENKFLALDTSAVIDVYLKYPGETAPRKIEYDNNILTFYPADATNLSKENKARAEFKPATLADGKYDLIIKDRDRSGNNSSTDKTKYVGNTALDYQICFEVINKPMITNVLNYPNPFTTATKFLFTITGSEIPDFMKIQIMTIKGTVVKEITKAELGDLHIGRNMTQYTWDGRDQYGDKLANGVYFYHVSARLDDKRMDHMSQSYDKYFKKGFGKLVIIR